MYAPLYIIEAELTEDMTEDMTEEVVQEVAQERETSEETSKENLEFDVIKSFLPRLIDKIDPEEIAPYLWAENMINRDVYDSSFNRSIPRKERSRVLTMAVLDTVECDQHKFKNFSSILTEHSKKPSINEIGRQLVVQLQGKLL